MKALALLPLLILAACAAPPPATRVAMIEVTTASFHGSTSTQIFADGTRIDDVGRTDGGPPSHSVTQISPEAYARAAAVLARDGAKTKAALAQQAVPCMDYGTDLVRADPAVAGFDQVTTSCPDVAVSALMADVLSALTPS